MLHLRLILLFCLLNLTAMSQECDFLLTGKVIDNHDDQPLAGAVVRLGEHTGLTNSEGIFVFTNLCGGDHNLTISHVFCENLTQTLTISSSQQRTFFLEHHEELLEQIEVEATRKRGALSKSSVTLTQDELADNQGGNFGDLLSEVRGITMLKTGATISKPIINGLHSQRVLLLNNGMAMEGQQWGVEHAPEIDPYAVQSLSVIHGAGSVEFGPNALGGVILVEPAPLRDFYGTTIESSLAGFSNGRGGKAALNVIGKQQVFGLPLSFQAQGSLGKTGNLRAPNYFLDNSATEEYNYMLRAGYVGDEFGLDVKSSQYNSHLGILTDSHIGNETDLLAIIENGEPFVDRGFSYDILRPRQEILHEISQAKGYYKTAFGTVTVDLSRQYNRRDEFDRSNEEPGLSLKTETYSEHLALAHSFTDKWTGKAGVQLQQQDYRAGGFYLIPEYQQKSFGAFLFEKFAISDQFTVEGGVRIDRKTYDYDIPFNEFRRLDDQEIVYEQLGDDIGEVRNEFTDLLTASAGFSYTPTENLLLTTYFGVADRQPLPNELFSDGVHHGTALWEVGDPALEKERAHTVQLNAAYEKNNTAVYISGYQNLISDYIYLFPEQDLDPIFTIRGSFPVVRTTQSDVRMTGLNTELSHSFTDQLTVLTSSSLLWAHDKTLDEPLIYMPSNRLFHKLNYQVSDDVESSIAVTNVFEQTRVPNDDIIRDYTDPPAGYTTVDFSVGYNTVLGENNLRILGTIDNLTNTEFKDYLDRFRYFAHAPGLNVGLRINYQIK